MFRFIFGVFYHHHSNRELKKGKRCSGVFSDSPSATAVMALWRLGPPGLGPGFQPCVLCSLWESGTPSGLRRAFLHSASGEVGSLLLVVLAGPVSAPLSPVEGTEPRALVQADLVTGTCPVQSAESWILPLLQFMGETRHFLWLLLQRL